MEQAETPSATLKPLLACSPCCCPSAGALGQEQEEKEGVGGGREREGEVRRFARTRVKEERIGRLFAVPVRLPFPRHAHAAYAILQTFLSTCLPPPLPCTPARHCTPEPRRSRPVPEGAALRRSSRRTCQLAGGCWLQREGREVKPHRRCRGGRAQAVAAAAATASVAARA